MLKLDGELLINRLTNLGFPQMRARVEKSYILSWNNSLVSRPFPSLWTVLLLLCPSPLRRRLFTHHIQTPLFPPPLGKPCYDAPLRLQTQFHNQMYLDIMCVRVLASGGISLHLLHPFLPHRLRQRGVPTAPIWARTQMSSGVPLHGKRSPLACHCVGVWPMSPIRKLARIVPPPCKISLTYWWLLPPTTKS